jgi:hypothetical protein
MRTQGSWLKDDSGRTLILRGVNLGGSSKVPHRPNGATHLGLGELSAGAPGNAERAGSAQTIFNHREVSFVGRPFPLDEADEHFGRLAAWGFQFLRLVVTWEALEHAGPGLYDDEYLDYLSGLIEWANVHGLLVYIDPHQDVWSRFTGGDGAPGWTLEAVGLELRHLHETGAAFLHQFHSGPLPGFIWPTNATKLGAATMFTLFFGGDDFAPHTRVEGEPVQAYLQRHYIAAFCRLAEHLGKLRNVVGYGSMNEPLPGFIGLPLDEVPSGMLKKGPSPTPFQSMLIGAGYPQEVEVWETSRSQVGLVGRRTLNAQAVKVWRPDKPDIWKLHGVYSDEGGKPELLRPDYFTHHNGRSVDFERDYLKPFCRHMRHALREVDPDALFFFEGPPIPWGKPPPIEPEDGDVEGLVHAPHWYDGLSLFTKHYEPELTLDATSMTPVLGAAEVSASFVSQLAFLRRQLPYLPALLGEFGLPFDLDEGTSYRSGDYSDQIQALDSYYQAIEKNLLSCTQWNYTSDNSNAHGDNWNGEDLSIFSRDQQGNSEQIHSGGRALSAIVRPYARATAGRPLRMSYDRVSRRFSFAFEHDPSVAASTEIFIPDFPYPHGVNVEVSDGTYELHSLPGILRYKHAESSAEHQITVSPL